VVAESAPAVYLEFTQYPSCPACGLNYMGVNEWGEMSVTPTISFAFHGPKYQCLFGGQNTAHIDLTCRRCDFRWPMSTKSAIATS
jgi:hypothetical protein